MPVLAVLPALIAAGTGVAGAIEGAQAGNRQQKALSQQEQIAQQEMGDKQKIFDQLQPFFSQYLGQGSPFLAQQQTASAQQTAQQYGSEAGQFRNQMQTNGLGYGPSGATAAGLGGIATNAAATGAGNYLQNLLNNEQVKFQAAQGLQGVGQMAGASQNQPNVGVTLQPNSTANGLSGLGQILKGLLGNKGGASGGGGIGQFPVNPTNLPGIPSFGGDAPSTEGFTGGGMD